MYATEKSSINKPISNNKNKKIFQNTIKRIKICIFSKLFVNRITPRNKNSNQEDNMPIEEIILNNF